MTYDELKKHISTLLKSRREVAIPTNDDDIIPLVEQNMLMIANRYKVLALVTTNANFRVLRALPDGYFIRMPKPPRNGTDHIDMDRELHMAIANFVAADFCSSDYNRNILKKSGRRIVKDYAFKVYNTPEPEVAI